MASRHGGAASSRYSDTADEPPVRTRCATPRDAEGAADDVDQAPRGFVGHGRLVGHDDHVGAVDAQATHVSPRRSGRRG